MKKQRVLLTAVFLAAVMACAACGDKKEPEPEAEKVSEEAPDFDELYASAVEDAVFAEESEISDLVSLTEEDEMVSFDEEGRVLLCTWHNYPDSYPEGETVTIEWGPVWTFTDKEIASHAEELEKAEDSEMRLKQLIGFPPDAEHSTVTGFWVDPEDVKRPAYQSSPEDGSMETEFGEEPDEEFKEWFDENILWSYFYGTSPWTRLGYTYDWADNGTEYGMTEFIVGQDAQVEVAFTETTEEFLNRLSEE